MSWILSSTICKQHGVASPETIDLWHKLNVALGEKLMLEGDGYDSFFIFNYSNSSKFHSNSCRFYVHSCNDAFRYPFEVDGFAMAIDILYDSLKRGDLIEIAEGKFIDANDDNGKQIKKKIAPHTIYAGA